MRFTRELRVAQRLAVEAACVIREAAIEGFECSEKGDGDLVTSADLASDALLTTGLMESFPDDGILTEESGRIGGEGERVWILDPLDGTRAFARGEPGVCVHVALHAEGELQLGVVADVHARRVAFAVRGQGAFEQDENGDRMGRLQVGSMTRDTPRLVTSLSMSLNHRDAILESCGWSKGPRVRGAGYKTLTICRGEGEVYFSEHPLHVWDTAAPLVIAWEAGASASAPGGAELRFPLRSGWRHAEGMVLTAGLDHAMVLQSLSEAWSVRGDIG